LYFVDLVIDIYLVTFLCIQNFNQTVKTIKSMVRFGAIYPVDCSWTRLPSQTQLFPHPPYPSLFLATGGSRKSLLNFGSLRLGLGLAHFLPPVVSR